MPYQGIGLWAFPLSFGFDLNLDTHKWLFIDILINMHTAHSLQQTEGCHLAVDASSKLRRGCQTKKYLLAVDHQDLHCVV